MSIDLKFVKLTADVLTRNYFDKKKQQKQYQVPGSTVLKSPNMPYQYQVPGTRYHNTAVPYEVPGRCLGV